ncbi:MAG: hypothetical protein M3Q36_02515 [bacterium]|nr:hypothetical protein [bacterium]
MEDTETGAPYNCAEKLEFDTFDQAQASATTIMFQRGIKLKAYRCKHCKLWHLTSDYDD